MLIVDITCKKKKSTNIIQFLSIKKGKELSQIIIIITIKKNKKRSVIFVCSPRSNKTFLTLVIGFFYMVSIDGGQESFVLEVCEFHTIIKQNLVMYTCDRLLASTSSMQNHP